MILLKRCDFSCYWEKRGYGDVDKTKLFTIKLKTHEVV